MFRNNTHKKFNSRNRIKYNDESNSIHREKSKLRSQSDIEVTKSKIMLDINNIIVSKTLHSFIHDKRYTDETTRNTFITDEESKVNQFN